MSEHLKDWQDRANAETFGAVEQAALRHRMYAERARFHNALRAIIERADDVACEPRYRMQDIRRLAAEALGEG